MQDVEYIIDNPSIKPDSKSGVFIYEALVNGKKCKCYIKDYVDTMTFPLEEIVKEYNKIEHGDIEND